MKMQINKDTNIYCSFSIQAGNNGCVFFNKKFRLYKINSIYKSFSINNIEDGVKAAKILGFKGFAVSMPFKKEVLNYVDELSSEVKKIRAANTVLNVNNKLIAYNTDYLAIKEMLEELKTDFLYIIGDGGFGAAAKYACEILNIKNHVINRKNWDDLKLIKNSTVLNCTPIKLNFNNKQKIIYIDGNPKTKTGKLIASKQAAHQLKLYLKQTK